MLFTGNGSVKFFINFPVPCINAAVADHFEMFFRDMPDETFYELHNRKRFFDIGVIFVAVVMESDKVAIIFVNPGGGNNRASQIAPNVFYGGFGVAFSWLGIDIETVFVIPVTTGLYFFERGTDPGFQFTQQGSAESIAEVGIVEVIDIAPETIIAVTTFRNKAVYVRIPFQISAKGVEYHDETGSKVHGLILFKKHTGDNAVYGMEETVKERTVIEEKLPELFINGKNTMTVGDIEQLKGHGSSTLHCVEISAGRAEAAMAAKRNKFELSTEGTAIHSPTKGRVTTVDHFIHVFYHRLTRV